jgi:predicted MPP superfamily phosphohydrolase
MLRSRGSFLMRPVDTATEFNAWRTALKRRNLLGLVAACAAGSIANAFLIEPRRLSITRRDVSCGKLPPTLDGLRIGLLADFHYKPDRDDDLLHAIVDQVRHENLDILALAGDFIDSSPRVLVPLMDHLRKLTARHGVFAVMGNHDGWNISNATMRVRFEKEGISFLDNEHSMLTIRGESLAVAGTDYIWGGKPDPARTLRGIHTDTPVIALVHEPDYFDVMAAQRDILLQLSGHTHGGQCRVPLIGYAPVSVEHGRKYIYGGFARDDSKLFVTRGVGTTGLPVRFACPPELAVLTLRSARQS